MSLYGVSLNIVNTHKLDQCWHLQNLMNKEEKHFPKVWAKETFPTPAIGPAALPSSCCFFCRMKFWKVPILTLTLWVYYARHMNHWGRFLVEGLILFVDRLIWVIPYLANPPGEELPFNVTKYKEKDTLTEDLPGSSGFPHDQLWPLC